MRYPLDHLFASKHFLLIELRRLPHTGSDHLHMLMILDYEPGDSADEEPRPGAGDEEEAEEAIDKGNSYDSHSTLPVTLDKGVFDVYQNYLYKLFKNLQLDLSI
ncbi:MAG: hypothetical protein R6V27_05375 [Balneolaceae bacterium]